MSVEILVCRLKFCLLYGTIAATSTATLAMVRAQAGASVAPGAAEASIGFEVASIKSHPPDGTTNAGWGFTGDSFSATNLTVRTMLIFAYDLKTDSQVQGLPKWGDTDHWDIAARINDEDAQALRKLNWQQHTSEIQSLLKNLLAQRFQLRIHHETRELPIYELIVAKSGLKAIASENSVQRSGASSGDGRFDGGNINVAALASALSSSDDVSRIVVDKTGLTGRYDMRLRWTPASKQESADSGPSIFTALEEQLGLKLVPAKGPVDTVVIDHVERPSAN
jgi:uncharacterized protein (TIGR03435 family)